MTPKILNFHFFILLPIKMVHYIFLVSQCSTEMPRLMQQGVLQMQSQQCEEDLSSLPLLTTSDV